jgi:hypothetical protein
MKTGVMVVRLNWYGYWVVVGFLKKKKAAGGIVWGETGPGQPRRPRHIPGKFADEELTSQHFKAGRADWKDDFFSISENVKSKLRQSIWEAAIKKAGKQELLLSLHLLLKPYTALTVLQANAFRFAINNFIEEQTANCCSIHLNNEELLALWRNNR